MPEMHWRQSGFTYSTCGPKRKEIIKKNKQTGDTNPFTKKIKKKLKNLNKQEILIIFIKINLVKHVFNMIWHMEIVKTLKKEP